MTELYRHYNSENELLYVGISLSTTARLVQHRNHSDWFDLITRVEIERFGTRAAAIAAEKKAIKLEKPKFNVRCKDDYLLEPLLNPEINPQPPTDYLIKIGNVAEQLGTSVKTVRRMVARGDLPFVCLSSRIIRYRQSDVTMIIDKILGNTFSRQDGLGNGLGNTFSRQLVVKQSPHLDKIGHNICAKNGI